MNPKLFSVRIFFTLVLTTATIYYLAQSNVAQFRTASRNVYWKFSQPCACKMPTHIPYNVLVDDVTVVQDLLKNGKVASEELVCLHLDQIRRYDHYLKAMLSTPPRDKLLSIAASLDKERAEGKIRGPLHGIPIVVKENVATHPSMEMRSSAGSWALADSRPKRNAKIIDQLIEAGLIILGKTNLSELAKFRGYNVLSGWSGMGGQAQSAYVRGGVDPEDSSDGHSNPSGSSSGSAIAVSAGYAPLSIGTETDGSIINPAGRAALYSLKPTLGVVSLDGIVPVSRNMDTAGPMGKSATDVSLVLDVLIDKDTPNYPENGYQSKPTVSWSDLSVAAVDPSVWIVGPPFMKPIEEANSEMIEGFQAAFNRIKHSAKNFHKDIPLVSWEEFMLDGEDAQFTVMVADFKRDFSEYLEDLEKSSVRTIQDVVDYNLKHADKELPNDFDQGLLLDAVKQNLTQEEYDKNFNHMRHVARDLGIEKIFSDYKADVIIGPSDSYLTTFASAGGYPIASAPLGTLKYNGRPYGVCAVAGRFQEQKLLHFLHAWESTFPPRQPPPMLVNDELPK